jgi:hypothetical protein
MSRKITNESIAAFLSNKPFSKANMTVIVDDEDNIGDTCVYLLLHGNEIARKNLNGTSLEITDAGWPTRTTRERLNGLPGVCVFQKKHQQYLASTENGVTNFKLATEWDGGWVSVSALEIVNA